MLPDKELNQLRDQWVVEAPASDLADRIVRHALAQPQRRPFFMRLRESLALPKPQFAMGGLAVAACLTLAIVALQNPSAPQRDAKGQAYEAPMDQIVEDLIWNDYTY